MPWEFDKLTTRDLQDIRLAERAEAYIKQEQRNQQQHNRSENFGNVSKSRSEFKELHKHGA